MTINIYGPNRLAGGLSATCHRTLERYVLSAGRDTAGISAHLAIPRFGRGLADDRIRCPRIHSAEV